MDLSEAVKEYRKEHKYSLREFANLCGLSLLRYRKQKRNKKSPPRREGVLTTGRREPVTKLF